MAQALDKDYRFRASGADFLTRIGFWPYRIPWPREVLYTSRDGYALQRGHSVNDFLARCSLIPPTASRTSIRAWGSDHRRWLVVGWTSG